MRKTLCPTKLTHLGQNHNCYFSIQCLRKFPEILLVKDHITQSNVFNRHVYKPQNNSYLQQLKTVNKWITVIPVQNRNTVQPKTQSIVAVVSVVLYKRAWWSQKGSYSWTWWSRFSGLCTLFPGGMSVCFLILVPFGSSASDRSFQWWGGQYLWWAALSV